MRGLRRVLRCLAEEAILAFPEGRTKCQLRIFLLRYLRNLPQCAYASRGETVVQGGVYMIETLNEWCRIVGPVGRVIAIEADPENARILRRDVDRRHLRNVTVIDRAIWRGPSSVTLQVSQFSYRNKLKDSGAVSVYEGRKGDDALYGDTKAAFVLETEKFHENEVTVRADSIDDILSSLGIDNVNHVHLTVSGADVEAVEGMERTLMKSGIRVFCRSLLMAGDGKSPLSVQVRDMLSAKGLTAVCAKKDPQRTGNNVYGWRS